jgi:hypothetical protein
MFQRTYQQELWNPALLLKRLPRPFGANPWIDVGYIAAITILQTAILPTFLPKQLVTDLLTPWLAVAVVLLPTHRAIPLILLSALLIETRSAAPAGLYITAYWILGTVVTLSRNAISWNNRAPWLSLVIFSEVWIFGAEYLVALLAGQEASMDYRLYLYQAARIAMSAFFGLFVIIKLAPKIRKGKPVDG